MGFCRVLIGLFLVFSSVTGRSADEIPDCLSFGDNQPLSINNSEVLHWKRTTRNQFQERAHVSGVLSRIYASHNGHHHFEIRLGKNDNDTLEIIYNDDFGRIPDLFIGMEVEACGDYITSIAPSGPYPASPDGAIVHWIHRSPSPNRHPSGYLVLNGELCGQDGRESRVRAGKPRRHNSRSRAPRQAQRPN